MGQGLRRALGVGGGVGGTVWAGGLSHAWLSCLPLLSITHSSDYSGCLPTVVDMDPWDVPATILMGLSEHHLAVPVAAGGLTVSHMVCVAGGVWRPLFPIQRHREESKAPWASRLLWLLMSVAVVAFKCCSSGDRQTCRGTQGWRWSW